MLVTTSYRRKRVPMLAQPSELASEQAVPVACFRGRRSAIFFPLLLPALSFIHPHSILTCILSSSSGTYGERLYTIIT